MSLFHLTADFLYTNEADCSSSIHQDTDATMEVNSYTTTKDLTRCLLELDSPCIKPMGKR